MNRAVCVNTWREFKGNNVRLILLTLIMLAPLASFTYRRCSYPAEISEDMMSFPVIASFITLLWGAGCIGKERQNGTIALVLARPITIANYVISKWFAVGLASAVCALQLLLIEHAVSIYFSPSLISSTDFLVNGLERVLISFGTAAVLVFYSSLVSGIKDLALLGGTGLAILLCAQFASPFMYSQGTTEQQAFFSHWVHIMGAACLAVFYPDIPLNDLLNGGGEYLYSVVNYACVLTVFLSLAIFFLRRKEFSYAQD